VAACRIRNLIATNNRSAFTGNDKAECKAQLEGGLIIKVQ